MSDQELEKKQETAVALNTSRRGLEEPDDQEDLIIPRVMLIQYTKPKTVEIDPKVHIPGTIMNSLTKEIFPLDAAGGVIFVPILKKKNWIKFNPMKKEDPKFDASVEPGAVIWKSDDPMDPKVLAGKDFGPNGEPPAVTAFINFLVFVPGSGKMPVMLSFSKSSHKAGKELISLARLSDGDLFSWRYRLKAKPEKNDLGEFFVLKVEKIGPNEGDDFKHCEKLWNEFHSRTLKVDEPAADADNVVPF